MDKKQKFAQMTDHVVFMDRKELRCHLKALGETPRGRTLRELGAQLAEARARAHLRGDAGGATVRRAGSDANRARVEEE